MVAAVHEKERQALLDDPPARVGRALIDHSTKSDTLWRHAQDHRPAFGWFASLAGACWRGDHPDGKTHDTQCYGWQYDRYLRGTVQLAGVKADGSAWALDGDSVYQWIVADGWIRCASWSNTGDLQQAEAYFEGESLVFPDVKSRDEEPITRSVWRKVDADSFEVLREKRGAGGWETDFTVTYRRTAVVPFTECSS